MKQFIILLLLACSTLSTSFAGETNETKKSFIDIFPGKPVITIFANYHQNLNGNSDLSEFGLKRAYLGYKFDNDKAWSGAVIFDIAAGNVVDSELEFTSTLKNAYVTWKQSKFKLSLGIIKTNNFSLQEKMWGNRYVMECYVDEYNIAPSADLGFSANYKINDWINADFSFTNGKGNTKLQIDGNFRYGFGLTLEPIENIFVKVFYDMYSKDRGGDLSQHTITTFVGYVHNKYNIGAEYLSVLNTKFKKGLNTGGLSIFSNAKIIDKVSGFARYDLYRSNESSFSDAGSGVRAGIDYQPFSFMRLSPNIYSWNPKISESETYLYLNILINF